MGHRSAVGLGLGCGSDYYLGVVSDYVVVFLGYDVVGWGEGGATDLAEFGGGGLGRGVGRWDVGLEEVGGEGGGGGGFGDAAH